jgi:hypothetical protein
MKLDEIVADPVLQLNLLLWMTREQPEESYRVRPIFFKAGFDLWDIDATFTLPEAVIAQIQNKNLPVKVNLSPDLRLRNTSQSKALYIEAKKSSFTPESSNSEQARAHLLAAGPLAIENYKPITELRSAVICTKALSVFTPDYSVEFLPTNPWIHQPFESYDALGPQQLLVKWSV